MEKIFKILKENKIILYVLIICAVISAVAISIAAIMGANHKKVEAISSLIAEADKLCASYKYEEAESLLKESKYKKNERIINALNTVTGKKKELVEYDGKIYHVFFHSLIIYPELAFDGEYIVVGTPTILSGF